MEGQRLGAVGVESFRVFHLFNSLALPTASKTCLQPAGEAAVIEGIAPGRIKPSSPSQIACLSSGSI